MNRLLALLLFLVLGVFGCGSSGSTPESPTIVTGQFVDSVVSGLKYTCSSGRSGITNDNGEFSCQESDTVEFFIGN